ncbi:unnamed protein product [Blepharisma stoltei]|uniref:Uncharacterized protein n=1 Tax=Blepharisma stoltei TaxID=1481888 RepID=A0AAU9J246_9CILI|nr:unnamed protein product [Blepharisma stoltei]
MSTSLRVNAFLDRVKNVSQTPAPPAYSHKQDLGRHYARAITQPVSKSPKVDESIVSESNDFRTSTPTSETQSYSPELSSKSRKASDYSSLIKTPPKFRPNDGMKPSRVMSKNHDAPKEIERLTNEFLKSRRVLEKQIENKKQNEIHTLALLKNFIERERNKAKLDPETTLIKDMYEKKTEKFLQAIEEEVKVMDKKLLDAQEENRQLRRMNGGSPMRNDSKTAIGKIEKEAKLEIKQRYGELVQDISSSIKISSNGKYSVRVDEAVNKWYKNIDLQQEEWSLMKTALCKELSSEQKRRLKTEENTSKLIAHEEKVIADLEMRIKEEQNKPIGKGKYMEQREETTQLSLSQEQSARKLAKSVLQNIYDCVIEVYVSHK